MFLALKEIRYAKLRYGLVIGIMLLVAYVVFILSGLAFGLSNQFKQAVEDWQPTEVILSTDSNKTFAASQLKNSDLNQVNAPKKVGIGMLSGAIKEGDQQLNVTLFAGKADAFFMPKVTSGQMFDQKNEVIISKNLAEQGYKIGDEVKLGSSKTKLKITGIFKPTYFNATPVVYSSLATWRQLKFGNQPLSDDQPLNAVLTRGKTTIKQNGTAIEKLSKTQFIDNIPGYSAQNITLMGMIYFLFVIVTAVIGIFMYVITLQKTAIFGVMKAQGISNQFIARSIISQSLIVGIIGSGLAFLLAYLTSFILPTAMPFAIDLSQWLLDSGILIAAAVLGGLFSIRTVAQVDPITAIGG